MKNRSWWFDPTPLHQFGDVVQRKNIAFARRRWGFDFPRLHQLSRDGPVARRRSHTPETWVRLPLPQPCRCSSMVELLFCKQLTGVRFLAPAPTKGEIIMLASFNKTGPLASNQAMQVQVLPPVPTLVPRVKETNRHPVEVEKASASLVGTASLRSSAAEHLALNQGWRRCKSYRGHHSYPGVAQSAQRASFGARRSKVRILPPRPSLQGGVAVARETLTLEAGVRFPALKPHTSVV